MFWRLPLPRHFCCTRSAHGNRVMTDQTMYGTRRTTVARGAAALVAAWSQAAAQTRQPGQAAEAQPVPYQRSIHNVS